MVALIALLLCAALVLGILEVVLPTGGLLGLIGLLLAIAAVWLLFLMNPVAGWIGLAVMVSFAVAIPLAGAWFLAHTRAGQRWVLVRAKGGMGRDVKLDPQRDDDAQSLIGQEGVTLGMCRPVGLCRFGPKTIECLSVSGLLDPGTRIEVVSVHGIEVRVRRL